MNTETKPGATSANGKCNKLAEKASCVVRMKHQTRARLDAIVERVNKKHPGKAKIRADAVICYALGLLDETHFESLRVQSLSNEDRFSMRFEAMSKGRSSLSWEDYLGLVMDGKVTFCPESDQG